MTNVELAKRIIKHIPRSKDPILVIIKCHLLIEERLERIIASQVETPALLKNTKFTFDQKFLLAQALSGYPERKE